MKPEINLVDAFRDNDGDDFNDDLHMKDKDRMTKAEWHAHNKILQRLDRSVWHIAYRYFVWDDAPGGKPLIGAVLYHNYSGLWRFLTPDGRLHRFTVMLGQWVATQHKRWAEEPLLQRISSEIQPLPEAMQNELIENSGVGKADFRSIVRFRKSSIEHRNVMAVMGALEAHLSGVDTCDLKQMSDFAPHASVFKALAEPNRPENRTTHPKPGDHQPSPAQPSLMDVVRAGDIDVPIAPDAESLAELRERGGRKPEPASEPRRMAMLLVDLDEDGLPDFGSTLMRRLQAAGISNEQLMSELGLEKEALECLTPQSPSIPTKIMEELLGLAFFGRKRQRADGDNPR